MVCVWWFWLTNADCYVWFMVFVVCLACCDYCWVYGLRFVLTYACEVRCLVVWFTEMFGCCFVGFGGCVLLFVFLVWNDGYWCFGNLCFLLCDLVGIVVV